ncbi:MAG: FAD-dependent monooxygenase [Phycisphaerales bacterium]|nr:FAD-dependent monooxygenase [Phycisphaerales bacterium]
MSDVTAPRAIIIGGGLVGPLAGCMLRQRGWQVTLLEKRGDPRAQGYGGGRSINLALSHRGIRALAEVELDRRVLQDAIPMRGRCIHDAQGDVTMQPYSARSSRFINSVSRGGLNCTLLEAAEQAGVELMFDVAIDAVDCDSAGVRLGSGAALEADLLLGADGAGSQIRSVMADAGALVAEQVMLPHGYKELHIPPGDGGSWQLAREALHIWPRGGSMMIALPNPDGSFTCTLFWPKESEPGAHERVSFATGSADVVRQTYPDAAARMPSLEDDWSNNPVGALGTIRCDRWHMGRTLLIGDAAHAIVPFYGQGMNAGFEDVRLLGESIDRGESVEAFARKRKVDADAIADLALHNFIEMRDHTASPQFARRQRRRQRLSKLFPWLQTTYEQVTFTDRPYSLALRSLRSRGMIFHGLLAWQVTSWTILACLLVGLALSRMS